MASGPYPDPRRGTWSVQYFDGKAWRRKVVARSPGWKKGAALPKKPPLEAVQALAHYAEVERLARMGRHAAPETTVKDFLAAYQAGYALKRTAGSAEELRKAVDGFLGWCRARKVVRLDQVTSDVCRRWIEDRATVPSKLTGRRIAHKTLKKERALLAAAWGQAVRHETIPRNPWLPIEVPIPAVKKKKGSWTMAEIDRLVAVSRPWLRDVILLGCHTGIRISGLLGLEWRDVRWNTGGGKRFGTIEVRPELDKAGKGYEVPIDRVAHDVLARRLARRDAGVTRVLTGMGGQPTRSPVTARAIRAACERAGLPCPDSPNHHMRRSFGRLAVLGPLVGRPVPLYIVSRWMGHSSVKMTEEYLDLKLDESQDWMLGPEDGLPPAP